MIGDVTLIYTIFGSQTAAQRASDALLDAQLVACVNRFAPVTSVYEWEGARVTETEYPVLFKTSAAQAQAARAAIRAQHDYALPAILSWEAHSDSDYQAWLTGQLAAPQRRA
jgi:periplasmic divalent cation tolerance protein